MPESVCALCLMEPVSSASSEAKVCEKCCRKHNLREKYKNRESYATSSGAEVRPYLENRCNLCKMVLPHASKLQEHLVEHTFAGCEERGYICYICSAVFTATSGLLNHMHEHGQNARPYDCNLCTEKYFFRAELDHHLVEHELRDAAAVTREAVVPKVAPKENHTFIGRVEPEQKRPAVGNLPLTEVKQELFDVDNKSNAGDEDEYIEVEQVPEALLTQQSALQRQQEETSAKCEIRKLSAEQQERGERTARGAEA